MKQKKGSTGVDAFTDGKLKLVNDILLYYNSLYRDDEDTLVEDPTQWVKAKFRKWKSNGYPLSTDALNASQAVDTANAVNANLNATNTREPVSKTKLEEDTWLS